MIDELRRRILIGFPRRFENARLRHFKQRMPRSGHQLTILQRKSMTTT